MPFQKFGILALRASAMASPMPSSNKNVDGTSTRSDLVASYKPGKENVDDMRLQHWVGQKTCTLSRNMLSHPIGLHWARTTSSSINRPYTTSTSSLSCRGLWWCTEMAWAGSWVPWLDFFTCDSARTGWLGLPIVRTASLILLNFFKALMSWFTKWFYLRFLGTSLLLFR